MDNIDRELLKLLNNPMMFNNLTTKLKLTNQELIDRLNKLKMNGYLFDRECYEDRVYYKLKKSLKEDKIPLTINHNNKDMRMMLISDFHIGSDYDSPEKFEYIYNYCIQNKIHSILVLGDIINGTKYEKSLRVKNIESQLCEFIEKYPYDSSINNYILLGNHDFHSIQQESFDISKMLFNSRYDFINLGYIESLIRIYGFPILLLHSNKDDSMIHKYLREYPDISLVLEGHFHKFAIDRVNNSVIKLNVPTLSNDPRFLYSGAVDLTIANCFQDLVINPLCVNDSSVVPIGEIHQKVLRK